MPAPGTLAGIRSGGNVAGSLAGQIGAIRQKRKEAAIAAQQNLRDYMLEAYKAETDARRKSVQSQTDLDKMRRAQQMRQSELLFGFLQGASALTDDPERLVEYLSRRPRAAKMVGIDPTNPDVRRIEALRDQYEVTVSKGALDVDRPEFSKYVRAGSRLGLALGLDRNMEVQFVGDDLTVENLQAGRSKPVDFQYVGPQSQAGPTGFQEGMSEYRVEEVQKALAQGDVAASNLDETHSMQSALEGARGEGAITGAFAEPRLFIARALELANLKPERVAPGVLSPSAKMEVFDANTNALAVQILNSMEGWASKIKIETIKRSLPQLAASPEGNELLLELMERKHVRDIQLQAIAQVFAQTPQGFLTRPMEIPGVGNMEAGTSFLDAKRKYKEKNPVFTKELEKAIREAGTGPLQVPLDSAGDPDVSQMLEGELYKLPADAGDYKKGTVVRFKGFNENDQAVFDIVERAE